MTASPTTPKFAAVVLAGGRSVRMGADKSQMPWGGQALWQHQMATLIELEPARLLLSCRAEQQLKADLNVEVVLDPPDKDEGPLDAVARCMQTVSMPLLVLAVDLPSMAAHFIKERLMPYVDDKCGAVFQASHGFEPLAAVYPASMLPLIEEALATGVKGFQPVLARAVATGLMNVVPLRPQDEPYFRNLNTPTDIERVRDDAFATPVRLVRHTRDKSPVSQEDVVAREEPLEIRVEGRSVAVVMRTPGHDRELAAGFLVSEGVASSAKDILEISQCPTTGDKRGNVVDVLLGGAVVSWDSLTRHVFSASSCGICGKTSIESVFQRFPAITPEWAIDPALLWSLATQLRESQATFSKTGGLHACALFNRKGELVAIREDVGRHNALDKLLGYGLLNDLLPFDNHVLFLSGRVSFEMMQKALAAGVPIVAAISAPSSLAVDFAEDANQTLVGFVRDPTLNVYSHARRILPLP